MSNYHVEISRCNKELTAKEKIMLKDTGDAVSLDSVTQEGNIIIFPVLYAELAVHNEKSANKDYSQYVIIDADNVKYVTSSQSFWNSFIGIAEEMADADEEGYAIKIYRRPSKNYTGKDFITCSLA